MDINKLTSHRENDFFKSVIAGMCIAFGYMLYGGSGVVNTFAIGIMIVYLGGFPLLTTYLPNVIAEIRGGERPFNTETVIKCLVVFIGNLVGGMIMTYLCRVMKYDLSYFMQLANVKANAYWFHMMLKGVCTGVLIGTAARIARYDPKNRDLNVVFYYALVTVFVTVGGEHVVANAFLILLNPLGAINFILPVLVGNFVGAWFVAKSERG